MLLGGEQRRHRHRRGRLIGLPPQRAGVVHGVDVILALFVIGEGEPVGLVRPGEAGRERRDARHAGVHVGELEDVAVAQVVQEDVADAGAVGDERERLPVGRPGRIDVLPLIHVSQQVDLAVVEVEQGDPHVAEREAVEVGFAPAIGREGDRLPVRRPGRLQVGVLVVGEPVQARPVRVDDEQIRDAAVVAGEDELFGVGGPGRRREPVQRQRDAAHLLVLLHVEDHEVVAVPALRGDGEVAAVGRPRAGRVDEAQALVIARQGGLHQAPQHLARLRVGEIEIDEERVLLAEVGDLAPVGPERGGDVQRALRALACEQGLRDAAGAVVVGELRQVRGLHRVAPPADQLVQGHPDHALERALDARRRGRLQDLADRVVAPLFPDVGPDGMPEVVREHLVVAQLLQGREVAFHGRVAQPHGGVVVDRPDREILRHSFHEPERRIDVHVGLDAGAHAAATEHVVLELVHHFVADHVVQLFVGARERQHHAVLEELGEAARLLADVARGGVGLLEVGLRRVENDGLPALELVMQHPRQPGVPALGDARPVECRCPLGRIVVDFEVFGLDDVEVEVLVLHFVLPEVLRYQRRRAEQRERRHDPAHASHDRHPFDPPSGAPAASTGASPHRRSS